MSSPRSGSWARQRGCRVSDAVILPFPSRSPEPLSRRERRALAKTIRCRECGAAISKPCTNKGTSIVRLSGPHPDRMAEAEAAAERNARA